MRQWRYFWLSRMTAVARPKLSSLAWLLLALGPGFLAAPLHGNESFLREVRPILQESCLGCHSGKSAMAKVDLASPEGLQRVVKPGQPEASLLFQVISHSGKSKMPLGKPQLSAAAIGRIANWIKAGAETGNLQHWAFQRPARPTPPAAGHPVDAFLRAAQLRKGLRPAPLADKRTLLRRVTLDLTGLPPTTEELRAFVADESPGAYERVVDRLLASPRYGERWGRHWMDIWRYSDWYGYRRSNDVRNSHRHIWQWRDWIVDSLNEDKPYSRMVQEMLAGDELAPNDPKIVRATGYLVRNYNRLDRDGWLQDAVDHTAMGFLGLTLKCARCHDHKYDPFSQAEYYQFRAFFEPYDVRIDRVPGQPDVEKAGLARVFDAKADAPTYLFVNGDVQNPDKSRTLTAAVPAVLGQLPPAAPVAVPLEARYPDLREFVHQDLLAEAHREIGQAVSPTARRAAEARFAALQARIAADKAKYRSAAETSSAEVDDAKKAEALAKAESLAKQAQVQERLAYVLTAEAKLAEATQRLAEALQANAPAHNSTAQSPTAQGPQRRALQRRAQQRRCRQPSTKRKWPPPRPR